MIHNLDGLLDILQFPVGYGLAVLQFLYVLSGSLALFLLPSLFCGLRRFVQNLFLLGNLFLCRFEGKVRFLRFCFPFWMFRAFSSTSFWAVRFSFCANSNASFFSFRFGIAASILFSVPLLLR